MTRSPLALLTISAGFLASNPVLAQTIVPPRHDTQSPTGVSYRGGGFNYSDTDLSIGGDGDDGIKLQRSYNSNVNGPADVYAATIGWTHSLLSYVTSQPMPVDPDDPRPPAPQRVPHIYHVTIGGQSIGFRGGSSFPSTGGPVGTYSPVSPSGASLVFNGTTSGGFYTATGADGTVNTYTPWSNSMLSNVTKPNGTRLDYTYSGGRIQSVISNRGFAILFESPTKVCAVNMAYTYVTAASTCPADAQTITYGYTASTYHTPLQLLTSVTKGGQTTTYSYGPADHLTCITEPGQAVCKIQNTYSVCPPDPSNPYFQPGVRLKDSVLTQQDAAGTTYGYSYTYDSCPSFGAPDYRPFSSNTATLTKNGNANGSVEANTGAMPATITDVLGRVTSITYFANGSWNLERVLPRAITYPEGNSEDYAHDVRGNVVLKTLHAKPGTGLADRVWSASYPTTCAN